MRSFFQVLGLLVEGIVDEMKKEGRKKPGLSCFCWLWEERRRNKGKNF